jgi:hypothetical protein
MGVENMSAEVFIIENVDVNAKVTAIFKAIYGPRTFKIAMEAGALRP